jgi:hypothetical protein
MKKAGKLIDLYCFFCYNKLAKISPLSRFNKEGGVGEE